MLLWLQEGVTWYGNILFATTPPPSKGVEPENEHLCIVRLRVGMMKVVQLFPVNNSYYGYRVALSRRPILFVLVKNHERL